jgi:hypothetical protein
MLELGHPRLTHRLQRPERKPDRGRPSQPPQQAPDDQVMLNLRANTAERSSRLAPLQQQRREQTKTAGIVKMHGTLHARHAIRPVRVRPPGASTRLSTRSRPLGTVADSYDNAQADTLIGLYKVECVRTTGRCGA